MSSDDNGAAPGTAEAAEFLKEVLAARTTNVESLQNATRVDFEDAEVEGTLLRGKPKNAEADGEIIHLNSYKK